ncbi:MAG: lipoate--protein ligase family protein [Acidobacteria bacterium]|nr:MAG: lipoate--protein ligase family protein [Acidobacteriota bacterium]
MSLSAWRLLDDPATRGAWNMAVDDALLRSCAAGAAGFPCLRFYRWDPPALSLGYHQDVAKAADASALEGMGVDLVRRPTGGRAVLHEYELTYSVVGQCRKGLLAGPVMQTYRRISEALVEGLLRLGFPALLSGGERPTPRESLDPCFARSARCEVETGGAKVVGSVQLQQGGALLQHGSILLRFDAARLALATGGGRVEKVVGLWGPGRPRVSHEELTAALVAGFEHCFEVKLQPAGLSPAETGEARRLEREFYGNVDWTRKKPGPRRTART